MNLELFPTEAPTLTEALMSIGLGHRPCTCRGEAHREVFAVDGGAVVGCFNARTAWRVLVHGGEVDA